jgi:hypothetical protein
MPTPKSARHYPRLRRSLLFVRLRQWARRASDLTRLGPSAAGRFACILITSTLAFGIVLALTFATGVPAGVSIPLALAIFVLTFAASSALMFVGTDGELAIRKEALLRDLPQARKAWQLYRKQLEIEQAERRAEAKADRERLQELADRRDRDERRHDDHRSRRRQSIPRWLDGNGSYSLEVVGESNYQKALERACGGRTKESQDLIVTAVLILDDDNPYDPKAVCVTVDGRTVGFLSRDHAKRFRARLRREGIREYEFPCKGNIRGGWDRGGGDFGYFGIWLDVCISGL